GMPPRPSRTSLDRRRERPYAAGPGSPSAQDSCEEALASTADGSTAADRFAAAERLGCEGRSAAASPDAVARPACLAAAPTKSRKSGWGRFGRLLSSGCACVATNHG